MRHDLDAFAASYLDSFKAQTAMFPGMITPTVNGQPCPEASVQPYIDKYSGMQDVLAWKLTGAGGGGYLAIVVSDATQYANNHNEAIRIKIRRQ